MHASVGARFPDPIEAVKFGERGPHTCAIMSCMDYAEARSAFFSPRANATMTPAVTPARALRDALEPVATVCYWSEPAYDAYAALGLDFLGGYIWGRASSLGEPNPGVVVAAFGVFEPELIAQQYLAGREIASLDRIRAARLDGSTTALQRALDSTDGVDKVVAALRRGIDAADPTARPFFAGLGDMPWPQDCLTALWHAANLLREYRGDAHLAACAGAGLTGLQANLLTEMRIGWEQHAYTGTRGWSAEAMHAATAQLRARGLTDDGTRLSAEGAALWERIEHDTDAALDPIVEAIGDELESVTATLNEWAEQIVAVGWFPPDPYKRAAG